MLQQIQIPISPMKKLKILAENQNIHNKHELGTKFNVEDELKHVKASAQLVDEHKEEDVELLLKETVDQYVIFPIKFSDMWQMYKSLVENFWSATDNLEDLELLKFNTNEIQYLKHLTQFNSLFNLKMQVYAEYFSRLIQVTEARFFYGHLLFVQNMHFEMFNKLYEVLPNNDNLAKFEQLEWVKNKYNIINEWCSDERSFGERLVASACLYGILFTSFNITKDWIDKRLNVQANHELVDNIHKLCIDQDFARDFACLMVSYLKHKPSQDFLLKTLADAVKVEREFLLNALPIHLIGINEQNVNVVLDKRANLLKIKLLHAYKGNKQQNIQTVEKKTTVSTTKPQIQQHQKTVFDEDF